MNLKCHSNLIQGDPSNKTDVQSSWVKMSCSRANMRAVGFKDDDFEKPFVTIVAPFNSGMPCNNKMRELADIVAAEVERQGGKAFVSFTPVISDGETQGTEAMRYSLVSREYIADCIEISHLGYMGDAIITLGACDKSVPGAVMPLLRMNSVGAFVFGGPAWPGHARPSKLDRNLDPGSVMEGIGAYGAGLIDIEELHTLECIAIPGSGTCSAMFTACSMASVIEALGLSLPGSAAHPAVVRETNEVHPDKVADCQATVSALFAMMRAKTTVNSILSVSSFHNAIAVLYALGGSTNAVIHLLALAAEGGFKLEIADFERIGSKVPLLANLSPHGRFHMTDLDKIGGVPLVMKVLLDAGLVDGSCQTITGKTVAENLSLVPSLQQIGTQNILLPPSHPVSPPGHHILVLQVCHVSPEAAEGGPIAHIHSGDEITINCEKRTLSVALTQEEFVTRREEWEKTRGEREAKKLDSLRSNSVLKKYAKLVTSAHFGATTN